MYRIFVFDRATAFVDKGVLYGDYVEVGKSSSQVVVFADLLPNALYGPNDYKNHFVLITRRPRNEAATFWFKTSDMEMNPMLGDGKDGEFAARRLLKEVGAQPAMPGDGKRRLRAVRGASEPT